jgi:hypothetical protein
MIVLYERRWRMKKDIKHEKIVQVFCEKCGGLKVLRVGKSVVLPKNWWKYGMASDIGCSCGGR